MSKAKLTVEELVPHRGVMKLLEEILEIDDREALARAVVSEDWPLYHEGKVDSVLIIELAAQAVAAVFGFRCLQGAGYNKGYLVGVKKASFQVPSMTVGNEVLIRVGVLYELDQYGVFKGYISCRSIPLGEVEIQVIANSEQHE